MFDNEIGVAGVAPKTKLFGASTNSITKVREEGKLGVVPLGSALTYLIAMNECKVINYSMGFDIASFAAGNRSEEHSSSSSPVTSKTIFSIL